MRFISVAVVVLSLLNCFNIGKTEQSLSDNERLYRAKCSSCHRLPDSKKHKADIWKNILVAHNQRLNLNDQQINAIFDFICQDSSLNLSK